MAETPVTTTGGLRVKSEDESEGRPKKVLCLAKFMSELPPKASKPSLTARMYFRFHCQAPMSITLAHDVTLCGLMNSASDLLETWTDCLLYAMLYRPPIRKHVLSIASLMDFLSG